MKHMFHLVVLDDEPPHADSILGNVKEWGFGEPFAGLHSVNKIDECLALPEAHKEEPSAGWGGEWLFLLDLNLAGTGEGEYGGFKAWSRVAAEQPADRHCFSVVYSQSLTEFIEAANEDERGARHLRPRLFMRAVARAGDREPWWLDACDWIVERRTELLKKADLNERAEVYAALRRNICSAPAEASRAIQELELKIFIREDYSEYWTVGHLFPIQAGIISRAADGDRAAPWQDAVLEICYALQPQFPLILHEACRVLFTDLRASADEGEKHIGNTIEDTVFHVAMAHEDYRKRFFETDAWRLLQGKMRMLKSRLETAYSLIPDGLRVAVEEDDLDVLLGELCAAPDGEQMLKVVNRMHQAILSAGLRYKWRKSHPDPRKDFLLVPTTAKVCGLIEAVVRNQAIEHGDLADAVPLTALNYKSHLYLLFKTQEAEGGKPLDPELMVERCKAERENPQATQLAGLVELICSQYRGKVYVIQEFRKDRAFHPLRVAVYSAEGGQPSSGKAAYLPKALPRELLSGGRIENFKNNLGVDQIKGTYYVLVFPHWSQRS